MEIAVGDEVDVKFTVKDLTLELNIVWQFYWLCYCICSAHSIQSIKLHFYWYTNGCLEAFLHPFMDSWGIRN